VGSWCNICFLPDFNFQFIFGLKTFRCNRIQLLQSDPAHNIKDDTINLVSRETINLVSRETGSSVIHFGVAGLVTSFVRGPPSGLL